MAEAMPLRKRPKGNFRRDVPQGTPLLLTNIGQLLTLSADTIGPRRGAALRELSIIEDAAVLCGTGQIISVGRTRDALRNPWIKRNRKRILEIDCGGRVALPGIVDSHTHTAVN